MSFFAARAPWSLVTYALKAGSSTVVVADPTITYSVLFPASLEAKDESITFWALIDSGVLVKEMSFVSTPLKSVAEATPATIITVIQIPITRQGWRALALAIVSG